MGYATQALSHVVALTCRSLHPDRENEHLANYGDTETARERIRVELLELVEGNPKIQNKLQFPAIRESSLKAIVGQR